MISTIYRWMYSTELRAVKVIEGRQKKTTEARAAASAVSFSPQRKSCQDCRHEDGTAAAAKSDKLLLSTEACQDGRSLEQILRRTTHELLSA